MDEILNEFREEYTEPEVETTEENPQTDADDENGEEMPEVPASWVEESPYSLRNILKDYRRMTLESRSEEEEEPEESSEAEESPLPSAETPKEPEAVPETGEAEENFSFRDILEEYRFSPGTEEKSEKQEDGENEIVFAAAEKTEEAPAAPPEVAAAALPEPAPAAGTAPQRDDDFAFHDILDEFLKMPDTGDHAPVQQEAAQAKTAAEEERLSSQGKKEEDLSNSGRWFTSSARREKRRAETRKETDRTQPAAGKKRQVTEEFPDTPKQNDEVFVDTLDYAAIYKMFADPEEAGRFEDMKPSESPEDSKINEILDGAAASPSEAERPAEEKKPLFAEENPDFRDILREFMMADQHPIYADMPGIGKKVEKPAEKTEEKEEPPTPRRRREYHVEEDFPENRLSAGTAEKRSDLSSEAESAARTDEEEPEKRSGIAGVRSFLSGFGIRKTENRKQALNSPKAFARYEDYLPDEETALQASPAESEETAEDRMPAESEAGKTETPPEPTGAHLGSSESRTEEELTEEDDELLYAGDFPGFGQWILNELMGLWIKLNGVGDRQSTATMQDDREELGSEVNVANASRYYGSQITMLRMRMQIGLAVLAILAYITLGFPVSGMLKTAKVAAGMCLALQLTVMLLCLDVVTNALVNLTRGRFGADALAVLACLISCFDALAVSMDAFGTPHIPLCLFSSLALMGILFADLLSARALRKSIRVPAIGKRAYCVTAEEGVRGGREITLLKSVRPMTGFVRRAEEAPPDEMLFTKAAAIELLAVFVLSLLIGLVKHSMKDLLYILSAMLSCTVPVTALLAFALPYFIGSQRIFSSGAAVAGWSGIHDIGCSRNLIVTDRDLFPEETVAIETVRVFADESAERVISYAGTMIAASGSGLGPCFADLMEKNNCRMQSIEDFKWLSGGGLQGLIEGHLVLCGGSDLMQLMNVKVPYRLVDRTTVLLAIDGVLYGIFKINYTGLPEIRSALQELIASNRHPIFAIRDFIITPDMLHSVFDVATDGYDFPPYGDRFRISEAKPSETSQVSAVICREGLGPLTHLADTGRSMYVAVRMNLILTALTAVAGTLLVFFRLIGPGVLNAWLPFVLMLLDAIFVMMISLFMRF